MRTRLKKRTLNYIIDDLIHPHVRKHPELKVADILLHFIVEDDPAMSLAKTFRYEVPKLIEELPSSRRKGRRRRGKR
jgi:hypothetical protein